MISPCIICESPCLGGISFVSDDAVYLVPLCETCQEKNLDLHPLCLCRNCGNAFMSHVNILKKEYSKDLSQIDKIEAGKPGAISVGECFKCKKDCKCDGSCGDNCKCKS